jgi:outer membrane lipoprotein SlyB
MDKLIAALAAAGLATTGCAHRPPASPDAVVLASGIIIDAKGKDRNVVLSDGAECAGIAESTDPGGRAAGAAIAGAVVGALFGALLYRSAGLSGNSGATYGAGAGALGGATGGAAAGANDFKTVVRNCMIGRGHVPLN